MLDTVYPFREHLNSVQHGLLDTVKQKKVSSFPDLPFLAFLGKARKTTKKNKDFSLCRTPKIPGKEEKNAQKSKEINSLRRKKQGNPKKQGKEDQGSVHLGTFKEGVSKQGVMTFAWRPGSQCHVAATRGADSVLASDCRAQFGRPSTRRGCRICVTLRSDDAERQCTGKQMRIPPFP